MTRLERLSIILRLIEAHESLLAAHLVQQWGERYRDPDPVIASFIRNDEKNYWLDYEPMLSDLRAAIKIEEEKEL